MGSLPPASHASDAPHDDTYDDSLDAVSTNFRVAPNERIQCTVAVNPQFTTARFDSLTFCSPLGAPQDQRKPSQKRRMLIDPDPTTTSSGIRVAIREVESSADSVSLSGR